MRSTRVTTPSRFPSPLGSSRPSRLVGRRAATSACPSTGESIGTSQKKKPGPLLFQCIRHKKNRYTWSAKNKAEAGTSVRLRSYDQPFPPGEYRQTSRTPLPPSAMSDSPVTRSVRSPRLGRETCPSPPHFSASQPVKGHSTDLRWCMSPRLLCKPSTSHPVYVPRLGSTSGCTYARLH